MNLYSPGRKADGRKRARPRFEAVLEARNYRIVVLLAGPVPGLRRRAQLAAIKTVKSFSSLVESRELFIRRFQKKSLVAAIKG